MAVGQNPTKAAPNTGNQIKALSITESLSSVQVVTESADYNSD
jgi:hypothetical protein